MSTSKTIFLALALLLLNSCIENKQEPIYKRALSESAENRVVVAKEIIQIYPNDVFGAAISQQIENVVGKEVTEEARLKFRKLISPEEFQQRRQDFLVQTFSVKELQIMAEILSRPEGLSFYEKIPQHDGRWREYLTPLLSSILSNG